MQCEKNNVSGSEQKRTEKKRIEKKRFEKKDLRRSSSVQDISHKIEHIIRKEFVTEAPINPEK